MEKLNNKNEINSFLIGTEAEYQKFINEERHPVTLDYVTFVREGNPNTPEWTEKMKLIKEIDAEYRALIKEIKESLSQAHNMPNFTEYDKAKASIAEKIDSLFE